MSAKGSAQFLVHGEHLHKILTIKINFSAPQMFHGWVVDVNQDGKWL